MYKYECETILNPKKFIVHRDFNKFKLETAIKHAVEKIEALMETVGDGFPDHASENNVYGTIGNEGGWCQGFWCGLLWLAFEATGDGKYRAAAEKCLESFYTRMDEKLCIDTHDMGFLYVPSCVAAYKITKNEKAKEYALKAAQHLVGRYNVSGGYIQAWGKPGEQNRLIIDSMNNLPLLYWASEVTGNPDYYEIAYNHAVTTCKYVIRENSSTYHTYYFNSDGKADRGATHQGAGDNSCWARGQAWFISGAPISYHYTEDEDFLLLNKRIVNYFLNRLPDDFVPYWDLDFIEGDEPRDSSAAAIAACGILQMIEFLDETDPLKEIYTGAALNIMNSLYENYSTKDDKISNGLLLHAVYAKPQNSGVDECNIWGCYYYMEALMRMYKGLKGYW